MSGFDTKVTVYFGMNEKVYVFFVEWNSDASDNAQSEIRRIFQRRGFGWQQGGVYFGGDNVNARLPVSLSGKI